MIFYFSGTGNSRYIAERISKELMDELIDINVKIKNNNKLPIYTGSDIIIVTPTYAWRIPRIVSEWLLQVELIGSKRIWFIMSCGSEIGNASKYNFIIAKNKQLSYMETAQVTMPENYIAMFNAPTSDEAKEIVKRAEPFIDDAIAHIKLGQSFAMPKKSLYDRFMSGPINPIFYHFFVKSKAFRVKNTCIGCGQCVKRCPMNNISIKDNKPVWKSYCTHCMACICYCPLEAIEYGKKSVGKPRYQFEKIKF